MEQKRTVKNFILLGILLVFLLVLYLLSGSSYGFVETLQGLFLTGDETLWFIVLKLRLPRMLMALLLGGALGLSGYFLQTFFQNPIAGPYVLGISSGGKLFVAAVMVLGVSRGVTVSGVLLVASALLGCLLVTALVLLLSRKVQHIASLLVAGIMVGYLCSSLTELMINFAGSEHVAALHSWAQGSFSGASMKNVWIAAIVVITTFFLSCFLIKPITAYLTGEEYARSLGVDVKRFRMLLLLASSVLSACTVAFAGPVSFVGIAVPFLMRKLFVTHRPAVLIPATFLGGGMFCLLCDWIALKAFSPVELSVSTVTAFFGAPIVIFMIVGERRRSYGK